MYVCILFGQNVGVFPWSMRREVIIKQKGKYIHGGDDDKRTRTKISL